MTLYLDTSALVSAFTNEAATERVQDWLAEQDIEDCSISSLVITEFSSALSIKLRTSHITLAERVDILAAFARFATPNFHVLDVEPRQFRTAAVFADHYELGLRAADALHLAICADHGVRLCTLDRRLADAGPALGVATQLL